MSPQIQAEVAAFPPIGTTLPSPMYYQSARPNMATPVVVPRRSGPRLWFKRFMIGLLVLALLAVGFVGVKFLINASKSFDGSLFGFLRQEKLRGEDQGRVNILIAGNSADDEDHNGAELTDSIMLVSVDTENKRAFMLSIPRDLWVDTPTDGYSKINAVYSYAKQEGYSAPGYSEGAMGALQQVVGESLGIPIHYYALTNYTAFKQAVDAVGGIEVTIASSDPRGMYDPSRDWSGPRGTPLVRLSNGKHTLSGHEALNLARARGNAAGSYGFAQSDYTRTANQRMMLIALKDKASSAGVALNPIKVASLLDSFGDNVITDFTTSEVRRLYEITRDIPAGSITSVGLNDVNGRSLLTSYRGTGGQSALIPRQGRDDYSEIRSYIESLMAPPPQSQTSN